MDYKDTKKMLDSKYPFEEYLKHIHAVEYTGLDDEMSDNFYDWLTQLDVEEYIGHANAFGRLLIDSFVDKE